MTHLLNSSLLRLIAALLQNKVARSVFALGLVAINSAGCDESQFCANSCESDGWSRLIVGVQCDGVDVDLLVRNINGEESDGTSSCPRSIDALNRVCSRAFDATPSDTFLILRATIPDSEPYTVKILLANYSYCARNIAYVGVNCEDGGVRFSDVEYISPCSRAVNRRE